MVELALLNKTDLRRNGTLPPNKDIARDCFPRAGSLVVAHPTGNESGPAYRDERRQSRGRPSTRSQVGPDRVDRPGRVGDGRRSQPTRQFAQLLELAAFWEYELSPFRAQAQSCRTEPFRPVRLPKA